MVVAGGGGWSWAAMGSGPSRRESHICKHTSKMQRTEKMKHCLQKLIVREMKTKTMETNEKLVVKKTMTKDECF